MPSIVAISTFSSTVEVFSGPSAALGTSSEAETLEVGGRGVEAVVLGVLCHDTCTDPMSGIEVPFPSAYGEGCKNPLVEARRCITNLLSERSSSKLYLDFIRANHLEGLKFSANGLHAARYEIYISQCFLELYAPCTTPQV